MATGSEEYIKADKSTFANLCTAALLPLLLPVMLASLLDMVEVCPPKNVVTANVVSKALPPTVVMVAKVMVVGVELYTVTQVD